MQVTPAESAALVRAAETGNVATLSFVKGTRCGGCGEILPDQEGIARDCACIRTAGIECWCPDANIANGIPLATCPRDGEQGRANEVAAIERVPWYGQPEGA